MQEQESTTAQICSFARAFHSQYSQHKIFDDYLAFPLMGDSEYCRTGQLVWQDFVTNRFDQQLSPHYEQNGGLLIKYILPVPLSREAFIAKALDRFKKAHQTVRYVICGAGMDTFAFRNQSRDIDTYELDRAETQQYKLKRIHELGWKAVGRVHFIPVDFVKDRLDVILKQYGFEMKNPSFFSIAGVTYYLTRNEFSSLLGQLSHVCHEGDQIVFDFCDSQEKVCRDCRFTCWSAMAARYGEPMKEPFSLDDIKEMLQQNHFRMCCHESPQEIQQRYFYHRCDGLKAFDNIHFIVAEKRRVSS